MSTETNVPDFIGELGAGTVEAKLGIILSEAALATVLHGEGNKRGKVSIEFTMQRVGENDQVIISHKLSKSVPTKRGKKMEEDITDTSMFVGKGGKLTVNQPREDYDGQFSLHDISKSK